MTLPATAPPGIAHGGGTAVKAVVTPDDFIEDAISRFARTKRPIDVSFRRINASIRYGDRATHFLHPYPGKLLAHIPQFFMTCTRFAPPGTRVLDPFCGSGTTLVEAMIRGLPGIGIDVNPFAAMLSRAKTTMLDVVDVDTAARTAVRKMRRMRRTPERLIPNAQLWYSDQTLEALLRLRAALDDIPSGPLRTLLLVVLASTARVLSFADPRLPVPVRVDSERAKTPALRERFAAVEQRATSTDVGDHFLQAVAAACARLVSLRTLMPSGTGPEIEVTCENLVGEESPLRGDRGSKLVITSPPYCGAQKYVRSTSLALAWTSEIDRATLPDLEAATIGREHIRATGGSMPTIEPRWPRAQRVVDRIASRNRARGFIAASYLNEMNTALQRIASSIPPAGHLVLVIGDNLVAGLPFPATTLLRQRLEHHGLETICILRDAIPTRGLTGC